MCVLQAALPRGPHRRWSAIDLLVGGAHASTPGMSGHQLLGCRQYHRVQNCDLLRLDCHLDPWQANRDVPRGHQHTNAEVTFAIGQALG
eukprot:9952788-Lingulodinium_polyedra.AAC.1